MNRETLETDPPWPNASPGSAQGLASARPITYEDFLPVSAAGIFQSNLGGGHHETYTGNANRDAFEAALGAAVPDELALYAALEKGSIERVRERLFEEAQLEIDG